MSKSNSSQIVDKLQKPYENWSFTTEVFNKIINSDFKNNLNISNIQNINSTSFIYHALSAIGDKIGGVLYSNIVNYIDNIGNVDVCNIKSLESIMKMFGVKNSIFSTLTDMPLELQNAINLLSINRNLLLNSKYINKLCIQELSGEILQENTHKAELSSDIILSGSVEIKDYIDDDKFKIILYKIYSQILYSNIKDVYLDPLENERVYQNLDLYNSYVSNSHQLLTKTEAEKSTRLAYKLRYGISYNFNEETILDLIENGKAQYSDYSKYEQELLTLEDEYRHKAWIQSKSITRNFYYKVKHVQEYIDFIESYYFDIETKYTKSEEYKLDNNYFEIYQNSCTLLTKVDNTIYIDLNNQILPKVINNLVSSTIVIEKLRQKIKVLAQQLNMKGTFQLLEFLVYDYIRENTIENLNQFDGISCEFDSEATKLNILKYIDSTEYFNISVDADLSVLDKYTLNTPYWINQTGINSVNPINDTNIFKPLEVSQTYNYVFKDENIYQFYLSNLFTTFYTTSADFTEQILSDNEIITINKSVEEVQQEKLQDFLSTIYNLGADSTYIDISGNISTDSNNIKYSKQLLTQYGGLSTSNAPYYNHKNTRHPSYQLHPCIYNFSEVLTQTYPIEDLQILVASTMFELLKSNIDQYLDSEGYIISAWNNPLNLNSDYLTRYESASHIDQLNTTNPVFGYDGFAYSPAIKSLLANSTSFINEVKNNESQWYKGLSLSQVELTRIATQLELYIDAIKNIVQSEYYDIYRYCIDIYGNSYILLKKYDNVKSIEDLKNISENIRSTTPGMLWIRYKNYPIAFPAYVYNNDDNNNSVSQIYVDTGSESVQVFKEAQTWTDKFTGLPKILDIFMSEDGTKMLTLFIEKNNKYRVIPATINQKFNKDVNINRNVLKHIGYGKDNDCNGLEIKDDYVFKKFIITNNYLSFIQLKIDNISNNKYISINIVQFINDQNELATIENINDTLLDIKSSIVPYAYNLTTENAKIDVCDNIITLCYLQDFSNIYVKDYLDSTIYYNQLSSYLNIFDKVISTKKFYITSTGLVEKEDQIRQYIPYVDCGFYPAINSKSFNQGESQPINYSDTEIESRFNNYNIIKVQLIGDKTNNGIDYKQHLPIRMFEKYKFSLYELSTNLSVVSYDSAHFYESTSPKNCGNVSVIYKPYDLYKALSENNEELDINLNLKVDESFTKVFKDILSDNIFLKYDKISINPWLLVCPKDRTLDQDYPQYVKPGDVNQTVSADVSNIIELKILNDDTTGDEINLSINWLYNEENSIKIDINPQYFNKQKFENYPNYYNLQHTFLNLDYPGSGGYIKVYKNSVTPPDPNNSLMPDGTENLEYFYNEQNIEAILFIKNISDTKPKLIIVKEWPSTKITSYNNKDVIIETEDSTDLNHIAIAVESDATIAMSINN